MNGTNEHPYPDRQPEGRGASKASGSPSSGQPSSSNGKTLRNLGVGIAIAGCVVAILLAKRAREHTRLVAETEAMAISTVIVTQPKPGPKEKEITLPGNLTAYSEVSLSARTNGYIKSWNADLGAKVDEGEVLAEIEAPDVDAQLQQGAAQLAEAKANLENARLNFERQHDLLKSKATSQQEFDRAKTNMEAMAAALEAGEANVKNLTVQKGFQKIVVPFPSVVTRRNTDVGALVRAGTGEELFALARTDILRVFIAVPQVYSAGVGVNTPAYLELLEHPGEKFTGKVVNISGAMDPKTRTLLAEMQVPNAEGRLFPGAYAKVHLILDIKKPAITIPSNALIFRADGMQVARVDEQKKVHLQKVIIGHDFGSEVEITEGLDATASVVLNPSDSLTEGVTVHPELLEEKPAVAATKPASSK